KLRSSLTMLGIIIGIASVIAVMAIGETGQQQIVNEIVQFGANLFMVYTIWDSEEPYGDRDITVEDAEHLAKSSPYIDRMVPLTYTMDTLKGSKDQKQAQLIGTTSDFIDIRANLEVIQGRFFSPEDDKVGRSVIVLDEDLVPKLFGAEN